MSPLESEPVPTLPRRVRTGQVWWVPAALVVAWLVTALTPIPVWVGATYVLGNVVGTLVALRLEVARLDEWGGRRSDRRPLLRWLCIAQVPSGWGTLLFVALGVS